MKLGSINANSQNLSQYMKVIVYGESNVGKTRLSLTCTPKDLSKTLVISLEKKLSSIRSEPIPVHQISTFDEFSEVLNKLEENKHGFEWIVIDSLSKLASFALIKAKKRRGDGRQHYGILADLTMNAIERLNALPVNVYFVAQAKITQHDNGDKVGLRLPGKSLLESLPYEFDEVFYMSKGRENGEITVKLQTDTDGRIFAKDSSGKLPEFIEPNISLIYNMIMEDEETFEERMREERERLEKIEVDDRARLVVAIGEIELMDLNEPFINALLAMYKVEDLKDVESSRLENFYKRFSEASDKSEAAKKLIDKYGSKEDV